MITDAELDKLQADMEKNGLELEPRDTIANFVGRLHYKDVHVIDIYTNRFFVLRNGFGLSDDIVDIIKRLQQKKLNNPLAGNIF